MRRTFDVDVLECLKCGGRLRVVTVVDTPAAVSVEDADSGDLPTLAG